MIKKIGYSSLYLAPFLMLFWITEVDSDYYNESVKMGLYSHLIAVTFILACTFTFLRKITNITLNKIRNTKDLDYVTSTNAVIGILTGYSILLITVVVVLIAPDITSYGKWLRGLRELKIVNEIQKEKSAREQEYISEALEISKRKDETVYKTTYELTNRLKQIDKMKNSLSKGMQ